MEQRCPDEEQIRKDLHRTMPEQAFFHSEKEGQGARALLDACVLGSSLRAHFGLSSHRSRSEARPSLIASLCTHFKRAGIEWRR